MPITTLAPATTRRLPPPVTTVALSASTTLPVVYQWRFNGNNIPGASDPLLILTNVDSSASGLYSVAVSNPFGTALIADAGLFVNAPPELISSPLSQSIVLGSNVTFEVLISGAGPFTYQWRRDGTSIPGATTASYTLTNVQLTNAGTYNVLVANALASVFSSNAVLTVLPPFSITPQPQNQSVSVGGSVVLSVGAVGLGSFTGPFTYQWTFDGSNLAGQTATNLALANLQLTNSGAYACVVSSQLGDLVSADARLTVFNPFNLGSSSFQPGGLFQMVASGDNGRAYRLESTTNLVDWVPVVTNTISGGTATFTASGAASQALRFYRIVLLP